MVIHVHHRARKPSRGKGNGVQKHQMRTLTIIDTIGKSLVAVAAIAALVGQVACVRTVTITAASLAVGGALMLLIAQASRAILVGGRPSSR